MFNAHGDVVQAGNTYYHYDAFGNEQNASPTDANPFRYCGEMFDKETTTYYLRARYYAPRTGRFITEDPIRSGLNWYTYCENNPIMFIDPLGLADYIYTDKDKFIKENEYKTRIFGIKTKTPDRYYIEVDKERYLVNSIESIEFYFDASELNRKLMPEFGNDKMYDILKEGQEKGISLIDIFKESVGGYLDFKLELEKAVLYEINGVYYNKNEAGNYMWSYLLTANGYSPNLDGLLAQGGSIVSSRRFDEPWDVQARNRGEIDAYVYAGLSRKYGVTQVLSALQKHGRITKKELKTYLKK